MLPVLTEILPYLNQVKHINTLVEVDITCNSYNQLTIKKICRDNTLVEACTSYLQWRDRAVISYAVEVDLSDPLEAIVQRAWERTVWVHDYGTQACPDICHPGIYYRPSSPKQLLQWIKEYKLDGAIMHRTRSCRASCVGQVYIKNELEKDGFPCLIFESDMADPRAWSDAHVKSMFNAFIEVAAASKRGRAG